MVIYFDLWLFTPCDFSTLNDKSFYVTWQLVYYN